jgi:subtilisin family serine protease
MNLLEKKLLALLVLLYLTGQAGAQDISGMEASNEEKLKNWYLLGQISDSTDGINLNAAYQFLSGKKPEQVIVAVIDGGIDTTHEDLKDILWHNNREKPENGVDDDENGYIDDVHGWNFLGNSNGENVKKASAERDRVYYSFRTKFEGKDIVINQLDENERYQYQMWVKAAEQMKSQNDATADIMVIKAALSAFTKYNNVLTTEMKKDQFTNAELEEFIPETGNGRDAKTKFLNLLKVMNINETVTNKEILKDFTDYVNGLEEDLQNRKNGPINYRALIVKDDPDNISDINYGNNDVMGPDPEHGTHVSGIIAANRNNAIGVNGVADNVRIMTLRCVPDGDEYDKDIALAIRYAVNNGAKVINMSFGKSFSPHKDWIDAAVEYAASKDVLIVHAAGNDNRNTDTTDNYPNKFKLKTGLAMPNYISVGAASDDGWITPGKRIASFSNFGSKTVDLFAPGYKIYNTVPGGNQYGFHNGTSMAAPVVSGVAALIRGYFPHLSAVQVKYAIEKSCERLRDGNKIVNKPGGGEAEIDELCGCGGFLNALEAVKLASTIKPKK